MFSAQELEKYLEQAIRPEADGTFLVLPFAPLRIVYQVDRQTKERFVRFQLASWRVGIFVAVFTIALSVVIRSPWSVVAVIVGARVMYCGRTFVLLGPARRVTGTRWQRGLPRKEIPARRYLRLAFGWTALATVCALSSWIDLKRPGAAFPWLSLAITSAMIALAGFGFARYARNVKTDH